MAVVSTIVTAPTADPVSVSELKMQLRYGDNNDEDKFLARCIGAATEQLQVETNRQFVTAIRQYQLDQFPSDSEVIKLPMPPLVSVDSFQYVDTDGTTGDVASTVYDTDTDTEPGVIFLKYNQTWPGDARDTRNAVIVQYECGVAIGSVDDRIKHAVLLLAAHYAENREAFVVEQTVRTVEVPGLAALVSGLTVPWVT